MDERRIAAQNKEMHMKITINNMRPSACEDGTVAHFWCDVDGWKIHGCRIARMPDGFLRVTTARGGSRHSKIKRAVEPPREIWAAIVSAALFEFTQLPNAATHTVDDAVDEPMTLAGLSQLN